MLKKGLLTLLWSCTLMGCAIIKKNNCSTTNKVKSNYWQQQVDYIMDIDMDVKTYRYTGKQKLVYTNNSTDTLTKVYYHLYPNAFQPGSEMDIRLQNIKDPDGRMVHKEANHNSFIYKSKISELTPSEIGYLKINELQQEGVLISHKTQGTIAEVTLDKPLPPGTKTTLTMDFIGQVPKQIRRSGRNNKEGVALSMTQWYPKMAEYDHQGWHAYPYIAREFHGVWGNFDVKITIDKDYILGGSGVLQNANKIGYGYQDKNTVVPPHTTSSLTWHFKAEKVHDFSWAADTQYLHDVVQTPKTTLHFLYKDNPEIKQNWKTLQQKTQEMLDFYNKNIGAYPYPQYSVIQGGDGGMEYAMCTLITGNRSLNSLLGVTAHELGHAWFQHILATNEAKHEWMDEGFTTFIANLCMANINKSTNNPFQGAYYSYFNLVKSTEEQPQTTHADRYATNAAYGASSYSKGALFLTQLGYIIGNDALLESLRRFYNDFKFTHPTPNDFKRTAERVSGMHLDWYLLDWTQTTNTIDYGIDTITDTKENTTAITLKRTGLMPMPIDIVVVYKDGSKESFYIPLRMMYGQKENPYPSIPRKTLDSWAWAYPEYTFTIAREKTEIDQVIIDPTGTMADVYPEDNIRIMP